MNSLYIGAVKKSITLSTEYHPGLLKKSILTAKHAKTTFATTFTSLRRSKKASVVEIGAKCTKSRYYK